MFSKINKEKFFKRAVSALVMAPLAFGLIWYGQWPFLVFVLACAALASFEWVQLSLKTPRKVLTLPLGLAYILVSFVCCYFIREEYTPQIALMFICMVWMSDTSAYIFGQLIGGPKMASHISPNKTWAGLLGAVLGPSIICMIFAVLFHPKYSTDLRIIFILASFGIGFVIGVVGQAGDLIVSYFKRQAGAKDTGTLIPGHGGLLDRIDSMMLAAPVFLLILTRLPYVTG